MDKVLLSFWHLEGETHGIGNAALLDLPLTAFFASRHCPGVAIRAAMEWAVEQARLKNPVISGFHSPLEQSVLEVLLTAGAPCVIVIARKPDPARFPQTWTKALLDGTAAVVSMEDSTRRLTSESAERRNTWAAEHATRIVIAHASAGGNLVRQVEQWRKIGRTVEYCYCVDVDGPTLLRRNRSIP